MKVQQDTMLVCFNKVVENLSKNVDDIIFKNQHKSAEYIEKFKVITTDINLIRKEVSNTKLLSVDEWNVMKQQNKKLIDLTDRSKRNNLRIDGLGENQGGNLIKLKVKDLF